MTKLKFDVENIDKDEHLTIKNTLYENHISKFQSIHLINNLTKEAPIKAFLKQDDTYLSFILPHWTTYLFVENGWLYATSFPVSIPKEYHQYGKTTLFAKRDSDNDVPLKLDNMSELYLFEDITNLEKVAKLQKGLKNQYTPKIYVLDKWNNILLVDECKLSKSNLKFLRKMNMDCE